MKAELVMTEELAKRKRKAQAYMDSSCIRFMKDYTPRITGELIRSSIRGTVIGSGRIEYASPYARYLYYGVLYGPNYPITRNGQRIGWYSPKKKYPTSRKLQYSTSINRLAGPFWFERMKADKKAVILRGTALVWGSAK